MKRFEMPEIEAQPFSVEDIITLSGASGSGEEGGTIGGGGAWGDELPR